MVGAMTSQMVLFNTKPQFSMNGQAIMKVQEVLDSVFIGIVPLLIVFLCFKLLDKKVNVITIIALIIVLGLVLSLTGIC